MFEPRAAKEIESRLQSQGEPLLAGGSVYASIYTGGAKESHFCAASIGWSDLLRRKHPFRLVLLFVLNVYSMIRTLALLAAEIILALVDCARGLIAGRDLWKELKFIPARVGVCILMREMSVIGAKVDVARGLPSVFLDLIGFDEQSHRRGPSSRFAHWTLKGIDNAIHRIWKAAQRSARRDYDVWIFSDHGNEDALSYVREYGGSVQQAVEEVLETTVRTEIRPGWDNRGIRAKRTGAYLDRPKHRQAVATSQTDRDEGTQAKNEIVVAAMGPLGHVYLDRSLDERERERLGRSLVTQARIPMVLAADGPGRAKVWTRAGTFTLPEDAESVLATDHPFGDEVTRDLIAVCHHADAGDFVISGWNRNGPCYTFPIENGAHAGPSPEETHAFALLPSDAPPPRDQRAYLRPLSLRRAALHHLGRDTASPRPAPALDAERKVLRVMTYNVHSCVGLDGKLSPRRIARVIARHNPDVVALQEVDVGRSRTGNDDQAKLIADYLNMEYHFHPAMRVEEELYGDCVLSRLPMRLIKAAALPTIPQRASLEPRGALWVALQLGGISVQLVNTHLGLHTDEKLLQTRALLGAQWLSADDYAEPFILCGDFNARPPSRVWKLCAERWRDIQIETSAPAVRGTWFAHYPLVRIDHIFVSDDLEVVRVEVGDDHLSRVASDHRPLLAELRIKS
jgi:endonuclease/exonuclease/phosphatase family metal-dependent hydrolase